MTRWFSLALIGGALAAAALGLGILPSSAESAKVVPPPATDMPAGPFTFQCDRLSSSTDTDSKWVMTVGRFRKSRQNR